MIKVLDPAPRFPAKAVVGDELRNIGAEQFIAAGKWTVLVVFPMAWTLVCPTEIKALDAAAGQFAARHATVLLISTDSEFSLLSWNRTAAADGGLGGVAVPLLSDKSLQISRAYGVLQEDKGVALRATFLIDRAGIVRQATINDMTVGRSVEETLRLLDAYQFTDECGDVCPVNGRPGESGISPTSPRALALP